MSSKVAYAIGTVYVGCILNNVFLEYLVRDEPGSGNLITFSQFLFIAIHGFFTYSKYGKTKRMIPFKDYVTLVSLFFITSVFNNWVFGFNIPVPLHMIFRAGSLIANMIMGIIILKRRYSFSKFLSVGMITVGIAICTIISSGSSSKKMCTDCGLEPINLEPSSDDNEFFWWVAGIILLTAALLLSARMGIYQETIYRVHGKHPNEALYYTHLLSLPGFILYAPSIIEHTEKVISSEPYTLPFVEIAIPILVLYLIGNVLTQYLCISSVYLLTTECTSLTVTLVITLRKFISLLLSIVYFKNPFTWLHWFGTILVFAGTLIFAEIFTFKKDATQEKKQIDKKVK
ncbi:UDP-xylose and UDP-N-acetylglucosamine transporter-like [Onthophagus taurus]|uniref:UDP-xylose and UDP-N-acetylglucosamine transporter-like n=1 Tax=Onthophagus taurus TaxID=166361 RepID=UPI0039BE9170